MDTLAHGLYGAALVAGTRDEKKMLAAAIMGMMPDIVPYTVSLVQTHTTIFADNTNLYYATHSLLIVAIMAAILLIFKHRRWLIFVAPYLLHLLFDIPTHCGLYATRLFFPFNDLHFCGINYGSDWWMWEINYGVLVGIYYLIYTRFYKPFLKT